GHILLTRDNAGVTQIAIAAYSIGGGPKAANPPYTNPIPAGSSEGNGLLFFYDPQASEPARAGERIALAVTTRGFAIPLSGDVRDLDDKPVGKVEPRSYCFSFAPNLSFTELKQKSPTLALFIDRETRRDDNSLMLLRYDRTTKLWRQIAAMYQKELSLFAAPL